jgi:hypothetical protein
MLCRKRLPTPGKLSKDGSWHPRTTLTIREIKGKPGVEPRVLIGSYTDYYYLRRADGLRGPLQAGGC